MAMTVYPLLFEPILKEKVWGGRRLERLGKTLPPGASIGESWELVDLGATSASGGGGGAAHSVVANGPLAGRSVRELLATARNGVLGGARPTPDGGFPLLVKLLDARENLSIQVHPSPAYAAAHPGAHLKTECWLVLDATPGAVIYKGLRPGVSRAALEASLQRGDVADQLVAFPARVGDCHTLPSGTVHALGTGVLVAEVQTPSDTTFRLFDWGRAGRAMHVEEALACIDFGAGPPAPPRRFDGTGRARLAETPFFTIDQINAPVGGAVEVSPDGSPIVWICVRGCGRIVPARAGFEPVRVVAGATLLLPASMERAACEPMDRAHGVSLLEVRLAAGA